MTAVLRLSAGCTLGLFGVLVYLSYGQLMAGGQTVFDDQIAGYSVEQARPYLAALSEAQRQTYLGLFRWLDTGLPLFLALSLGLFIWREAGRVGAPLRSLMAASPLVYMVLDLIENALVADLLRAGPEVADAAIRQASMVTVAKFATLGAAVLVALAAWRLGRKKGQEV